MTTKPFELLVFDWDGTLSDSSAVIVDALQAGCRSLNLTVPSRDAVLNIIGLGLREGLFQAIPDLPEEAFEPLCQAYRSAYFKMDDIPLYEGVPDGLRRLAEAGYAMTIATGKSRAGLNRALEKAGIGDFFSMTCCADEYSSKPSPDMLFEIMQCHQVMPEKTVMIGDTTHDLQMAQNAKVAAIAMTYGAHPAAALVDYQPLGLFDRFDRLVDALIPKSASQP